MGLAEEQSQDEGPCLRAEGWRTGCRGEVATEGRSRDVVVGWLRQPKVVTAAGGIQEAASTLGRQGQVSEPDHDYTGWTGDHLEAALLVGLEGA